MVKKRLVGVITVKDGWAVQSFGYKRWLPVGRPEIVAENLDRWGVDEIMILAIDRSRQGLGPDLPLLRRLGALGLSTPVSYGGGVRTVEQAAAVVKSGAERVCVDAALRSDLKQVRGMARLLGAQALIAALPLSRENGKLLWLDYLTGKKDALPADWGALFEESVSEALLIDWTHEGTPESFDAGLVSAFPFEKVPLIVFGGISSSAQLSKLLAEPRVVAAGVGNFLNYAEHAVQNLKKGLPGVELRPPTYAGDR